ncbi:unnamed protein product [Blepharisma stoltei]|uniref:Uncharacterized protein n=1 Tax=Blepharisma stoltei TaxID=1481888 RepID=A0AAU9IJV1_9CILI|nr:unnamed protein product [Blepharisma stoltei]
MRTSSRDGISTPHSIYFAKPSPFESKKNFIRAQYKHQFLLERAHSSFLVQRYKDELADRSFRRFYNSPFASNPLAQYEINAHKRDMEKKLKIKKKPKILHDKDYFLRAKVMSRMKSRQSERNIKSADRAFRKSKDKAAELSIDSFKGLKDHSFRRSWGKLFVMDPHLFKSERE